MPRIFASSVFGIDLSTWGAWGFTDAGTRDKLGRLIGADDFVLSIGTSGPDTAEGDRGRLLGLMKIGSEPIDTQELVHPDVWDEVLRVSGGPRWAYAFAIRSAEEFEPKPLRSAILPRIDQDNLYMALARHFVELTPDEVARVLHLPRRSVAKIYSTHRSSFAAHLANHRNGPRPSAKSRTLTPQSGPASTYLLRLDGAAASAAAGPAVQSHHRLFKIGFSRDPEVRSSAINRYFPDETALGWKLVKAQGHADEINAYAFEQEMFRRLDEFGVRRIKGEIVSAPEDAIASLWAAALESATRPDQPVTIPVED